MKKNTNTEPFYKIARKAFKTENLKEFSKAFNLYKECFSLTENQKLRLKLQTKQAWCQFYVGNYQEAKELFQSEIEDFNRYHESYLNYSIYLVRIGNHPLAEKILKKGIQKFPKAVELYLTYAGILKNSERVEESIKVLKKVLSLKGVNLSKGIIKKRDIIAEIGNLYYERSQYQKAIQYFEEALRISTLDQFYHYEFLSVSYFKQERYREAYDAIQNHLQFYGESDAQILIFRARILIKMGNPDSAYKQIMQAYETFKHIELHVDDLVDLEPLIKNGTMDSLQLVN